MCFAPAGSWPPATSITSVVARLDGVARYIQEVGAEHLIDAGYAEIHPHWIVQRTVIDVIEPLDWPNDITFRRWCSGISLRWCSMRVRLDGSNGGRIETEGFWINMNKDTLTPSLMAEGFFNRLATTTENHRLKWRPWLPGPAERRGHGDPVCLALHRWRHFRTRQQHHLLARCARSARARARPFRAALPCGRGIP